MTTNINSENKFTLIIFGASGDLTKRKLMPALFDIFKSRMINESFNILGVGRKQLNTSTFREESLEFILNQEDINKDTVSQSSEFAEHLHYFSMDTTSPDAYMALRKHLEELSGKVCSANYLFYFAIPPFMYGNVAKNLYDAGLTCNMEGWKRVIVEKPFGSDYKTAIELNETLLKYFSEQQIYRIDHYLGKETVQNILVTRFSNAIFEPLWNRNYIDYIEITSSESIGVGSRAGYYDNAGALRDMVQNHLLQLIGIVAMEPPINAEANSIRDEMVKVFKSMRPITNENINKYVVLGQYEGYRKENGIKPNSNTETFVAMECYIDNWRWSGVPFFIRTGKMLPSRVTEIVIHFKPNPHKIFENPKRDTISNMLIIRIQPDEGMLLTVGMKVPGSGFEVKGVNMNFRYTSLSSYKLPSAYERLICDSIMGDATLYQRKDAVEATWTYVQPIIDAMEKGELPIYAYRCKSWGPEQAENMLKQHGHEWREPCSSIDGQFCKLG